VQWRGGEGEWWVLAGEKKMALKSIQRSATVAFAPMAQMMAVGTMAGAIDLSFSSSASLELLKLDFASTELDLPVLSSCVTAERFNRLSWGTFGAMGGSSLQEEFPLGVIAGGLADGSIHLWNPAKLIRFCFGFLLFLLFLLLLSVLIILA